ncbi:ELF3-like protein 2 [Rutidosis leptorrhynchoides]|uniref:ELF3-like protein 2 n=1 Tax=Rutidosis leptorrhynchoides TaxID=125765 RepID=UPI003A9A4AF4
MVNLKEEGKKMDPLFPRLHINDAEKGGPRTPPRNKMAISQTTQRSNFGSVSPILPPPNNNGGSLVPTTSSYHDASYKRSVFSSFGRSCGSTRLATRLDSYHSSGINLNISLTTVKQTIETTNCQTLCNTRHMKHDNRHHCLYKPQEFSSTRNTSLNNLEDEDEYLVPSLSIGNRGKIQTPSTNSHIQHHVCQKILDPNNKDIGLEDIVNTTTINGIARERTILEDETELLHDSSIRLPLKRKSCQENMPSTYKDGAKKMTLLGDDDEIDKGTHEVDGMNKNDEDQGSVHVEDEGKIDTGTKFLSSCITTPEEVERMIGSEHYCKTRRTIIQQQRVFQSQVFELHRLIKVQKSLARSPCLLLEDNFCKLKKLPSKDIDEHNKETLLSFAIDSTLKKPLSTNNDTKKGYNTSLIDLPPPPPLPPLSNLNGPKQPPWCYIPPPPQTNQWLVPVRSPSEGLVYKPYTGPSPPPFGLMTPVYGMSLTPSNGDFFTHTIPTSYQQRIGVFPSTPLFTSYTLPAITKPNCSPNIVNNVSFKESEHISRNVTIPCNLLNQENYKESELQGIGNYYCERKKDELPLFPTTPMVRDSDQCIEEKGFDDERIKVIKVVPHNPKLASESAARIFQFIQEERKYSE